MAIVGALRRLATEAVVMNARVTHVMQVGFGATVALAAGTANRSICGDIHRRHVHLRLRAPSAAASGCPSGSASPTAGENPDDDRPTRVP